MSIASARAVIDKVQDPATREALYSLWAALVDAFNNHTHVVSVGSYSSLPTKHASGQDTPQGESSSLPS